jgi:hypothetical protein
VAQIAIIEFYSHVKPLSLLKTMGGLRRPEFHLWAQPQCGKETTIAAQAQVEASRRKKAHRRATLFVPDDSK